MGEGLWPGVAGGDVNCKGIRHADFARISASCPETPWTSADGAHSIALPHVGAVYTCLPRRGNPLPSADFLRVAVSLRSDSIWRDDRGPPGGAGVDAPDIGAVHRPTSSVSPCRTDRKAVAPGLRGVYTTGDVRDARYVMHYPEHVFEWATEHQHTLFAACEVRKHDECVKFIAFTDEDGDVVQHCECACHLGQSRPEKMRAA